jgi:diguanylate cyclase (GGDEF)-like protein
MADEVREQEALVANALQASSGYLLEPVSDNLQKLGRPPHSAFLQTLLRGLTNIEATEKESILHWDGILARRRELTEKLGRPVLLRTAAVDYLGELQLMRKPILLECEELERLRRNAATDPLTGLKNRRMFEEYLAREISRSTRYGSPFALLLLDLRRFKLANDTYGHATGDEILRSVARASVETIRASDIACRIGGDEFAIILPRAERSSAETFAERIAKKFKLYGKPLAAGTPLGIDYGAAIFPEDGKGAAELFQTADKKLYESKQMASRPPGDSVVAAHGSALAV